MKHCKLFLNYLYIFHLLHYTIQTYRHKWKELHPFQMTRQFVTTNSFKSCIFTCFDFIEKCFHLHGHGRIKRKVLKQISEQKENLGMCVFVCVCVLKKHWRKFLSKYKMWRVRKKVKLLRGFCCKEEEENNTWRKKNINLRSNIVVLLLLLFIMK